MNHGYHVSCFATLLGLILGFSSVYAQEDPRLWDTDGIAVRQTTHLEWQQAVASNDQGQTCVAWSALKSGSWNQYIQVINPDGSLEWEEDGHVVASSAWDARHTVVVSVSDGWIVAWLSDGRLVSDEQYRTRRVYAQKISLSGIPLWGDTGVELFYTPDGYLTEGSVRAVHDANGGAFIAWVEARLSLDVSAVHVSAVGDLDWEEILYVTDIEGSQRDMNATDDGNGNMLLAWTDFRNANHQYLYGAKIMADGTMPWGEGVNGIPICTAREDQYNPVVCPDYTTGGMYCAWEERLEFGDRDIYMQRISGDGSMLWQTNGIPICDADWRQQRVMIAASFSDGSQDGVVCVWDDARSTEVNDEIYAQKVAHDGTALWIENGVLVCGNDCPGGTDAYRRSNCISTDFDGGAIISWSDCRNSDETIISQDLFSVRLNSEGINQWTDCGTTTADGYGEDINAVVTCNEASETADVIFLNTDYCQHTIKHKRLSAANGTILVEHESIFTESPNGDAEHPKAISMAGERAGIVWIDTRREGSYSGHSLYYQIVAADGALERPVNGSAAVTFENDYRLSSIDRFVLIDDNRGGFYLCYTVYNPDDNSEQVRLSRIDQSGEIANDSAGTVVSGSFLGTEGSSICSDRSDGCFVAWSEWNCFTDYTLDTYVRHFDENGNRTWSSPVQISESGVLATLAKQMVPSVDGCCIVVWASETAAEIRLHATRVCMDGTIDWSIPLCSNYEPWTEPNCISDGNGGAFIAWIDERYENLHDVYVQHLDADGNELWEHQGLRVSFAGAASVSFEYPNLAYSSEYGLYVVWEEYRFGNPQICAQRFDETSHSLWDYDGNIICDIPGLQDGTCISPNDHGGFFAVWRDRRNFYSDIYGSSIQPNGLPENIWWVEGSGGVICEASGSQFRPSLSPLTPLHTLVVWQDQRSSGSYKANDLYMQKINVGSPMEAPEAPSTTPLQFSLHQNYPNPFNPSTTISFTIPHTGQASLVVYDLLGRTVETLIDKQLTAGSYHVPWNAGELPSGVYFYRLNSGEFSDVKKMILLK